MYFGYYPCPPPEMDPLPHAPASCLCRLCPVNTNLNFPSLSSLPSTDIAATISCTSHFHSVLQKRLINHLCLEIQENEHLTRRGERRRQRLMTSGVGLRGRLGLAPRLPFKATGWMHCNCFVPKHIFSK